MTRKDYLEFLVEFISTCDSDNRFLSQHHHLLSANGVLFERAACQPDIVEGIMSEAYRINSTIHNEKVTEYLEELRAEWEVIS